MLSALDRRIIGVISQDIPLVEKPFEGLALRLGITEESLLKRIKSYRKDRLMRRFSAAVNHRKIGFKYNAMVVWNISDKFVEKAGRIMVSFPDVSHCYQRKRSPVWNYNLYSMIHGKTKKECLDVVEKISKRIDFRDYRVLFSSKEYKKTGAKYSP